MWFNNRVFGAGAGEVFGDTGAQPILPKGITVPDPGLNWIAARTRDRLWVILMNDAIPHGGSRRAGGLVLLCQAPYQVRLRIKSNPIGCFDSEDRWLGTPSLTKRNQVDRS